MPVPRQTDSTSVSAEDQRFEDLLRTAHNFLQKWSVIDPTTVDKHLTESSGPEEHPAKAFPSQQEMQMNERKLPTAEQIERRAYELYIDRGCEDGHALADWLAAERELMELYEAGAPSASRALEARAAAAGQ